MRESKLITVLSKLTDAEFDRLGKFLVSPYFEERYTHNEQVQQLYLILLKAFPAFDPKDLDKEKIYRQIFKGEKELKAGRLEKLMSYLFKRVEDWVFIEGQFDKESKFSKQQSLIDFYFEKKLDRQHLNAIKKQVKDQTKLKLKGKQDLYNDYLMNSLQSKYEALSNAKVGNLNLPATIESLDIYFLAARLEYSCNLLAQENFHNVIDANDSYVLLKELMPILSLEKYAEVPQVKIYLAVYKILETHELDVQLNLENIQHLEELLLEHKDSLPKPQVIGLHAFNRSLFMRVLNLGRLEFTAAAFELYKSHLNRGLLFNGKFLMQGMYKNIASIGIMLKKFDWVMDFLEENKHLVKGRDKTIDIYRFNVANCLFHQDKIEEAHELLPQHFEDLYYRLAAKRLEIKILCEQESDLLDFKLKAFNQYIYRISNTILPEAAQTSNYNFAKILLRILSPGNASLAKRKKIAKQIAQMDMIKEKEWLISLVNQ